MNMWGEEVLFIHDLTGYQAHVEKTKGLLSDMLLHFQIIIYIWCNFYPSDYLVSVSLVLLPL